jgi:pimeloyl-ACP methyl ester carboxylesterase
MKPIKLAYTDQGSGPVILLLHGMAGSKRYWEQLIPQLSHAHRVIAVDLLGFGHSPRAREYTYETHIRAIVDTLDSLGVSEPIKIVGMSMGALLALRLAAIYPDRVSDLILISLPLYRSADEAKLDITKGTRRRQFVYYGASSTLLCSLWCTALRPITRLLAPLYLGKLPRHVAQDSLLHTPRSYAQSLHNIIEHQQVVSDLDRLKAPVTFIYGDKDSKQVAANVKRLIKLEERLRILYLPGTHNVALEHPEKLHAVILER